ncbi:PTB domain-containing engulfment adapter protein 1-like [Watersipora subatra]|uniref:PTB domain-containing engulfment adapter protein 1-like n=1 Tax=Watersipora subatra TaxID=2589382 RepID=UPI00355BD3B9
MSGKVVSGNKQWPHAPEAMLRGRLVYTVKFYGEQEVQQAKGTEPIKEAVRKMKFNKQVRRAEGQKVTPKVELCINVDGISIQDPKSKVQQYKFPLHHISYCADDKVEKKLFTFIAKEGTTGKHLCFVLGSEKNAEEITLTIGQAFDLAYKRFLEKKDTQQDQQKQFILLQQQVEKLQLENKTLKSRIAELEAEKNYSNALNKSIPAQSAPQVSANQSANPTFSTLDDFLQPSPMISGKVATPVDTQASATSNGASVFLPPPPTTKPSSRTNSPNLRQLAQNDTLTQTTAPTGTSTSFDAFGMPSFNPGDLDEMENGFKGGKLAIGVEEFGLNSFDPLGIY